MTFEEDEELSPEELPDRATPLLAVVRIISVLGMAFGVSFGLFMALGFWWIPALLSFASAIPFFFLMRFMEKKAMTDRAGEH